MKQSVKDILKKLPSVDRISKTAQIQKLHRRFPRKLVLQEIRRVLGNIREEIKNEIRLSAPSLQDICTQITAEAQHKLNFSIKRGINAAGVILHTGMGRAPFAKTAQDALMDSVMNYCTLQIDQNTGKRGSRDAHIENLIREITGAEAATIVNNNAAATMLVLNTLSKNKEAIVSRGQLVEIGGSFRIPDVMEQSGALLREVGTTNRTHLRDYEGAIRTDQDEIQTGLLLHVHTSNYYISGFTSAVGVGEMASLAHRHNIPVYDDLGSGALIDLSRWGLPREPTIQDSIKHGADIVSFSGDKLLGGPQCGIIAGKKEIIDRIRKNQLSRSLRCDKMTYAVLEGTLRLFLDPKKLHEEHPVVSMLTRSVEDIHKEAKSLYRRIQPLIKNRADISLHRDISQVGSGSLARAEIPTWCISLHSRHLSTDSIGRSMRSHIPPVFGRIKNDAYLLDCRTLKKDEHGFVIDALQKVFTDTTDT
ncbi:MAG: L-seryl-tRNA(Sec) selenium transferase [Fibrobacterota bacterium]